MEPITPTIKVASNECHESTPLKARILGGIDFLVSEGIKGQKRAVFRASGVSHTKWTITPAQIREMEELLENEGLQSWNLAWLQLGYNLKSDIIFYDVPGHTKGKMSLQVLYINQILEPLVKPWLL